MSDFEEMLRGIGQTPEGVPQIGLPDDEELDDHARYDRATFLFETKAYSRAVELLTPLVEDNPGNAEIRLLLARAHYHSASLGRAEEVLRGLLERWPTDAYAHLLLALLEFEDGSGVLSGLGIDKARTEAIVVQFLSAAQTGKVPNAE